MFCSVLCFKIFTHNFVRITNNANKNACETARKINQIIPTNSTPNHHAQRFYSTSANMLNFHTTMIFPPVGKAFFVQNDGKTAQAYRCIKSRIITKVIDSVILVDTF